MVASRKWMEGALEVFLRHLSPADALALVRELRDIPNANASVRDTLAAMEQRLVEEAERP